MHTTGPVGHTGGRLPVSGIAPYAGTRVTASYGAAFDRAVDGAVSSPVVAAAPATRQSIALEFTLKDETYRFRRTDRAWRSGPCEFLLPTREAAQAAAVRSAAASGAPFCVEFARLATAHASSLRMGIRS